MSALGKIYEVNLNIMCKDAYPVVYKNKSYYYCKRFGSDALVRFDADSVIPLAAYKNLAKIPNTLRENPSYRVFVANKEKYNFPELKNNSAIRRVIEVERDIKHKKSAIFIQQKAKKRAERLIVTLTKELGDLTQELENLKVLAEPAEADNLDEKE